MTGEFKGRLPERGGMPRYVTAKELLEKQSVGRVRRFAQEAAFWLVLAIVLALVGFSFAYVPQWYALHRWKVQHISQGRPEADSILPMGLDQPLGMPGMRIARFRVNAAVHRLEAYVEPVALAGAPSPGYPAYPAPQAPGAWMTAAGLYRGVPVALKVNAAGALSLGSLIGGTPARCIGCIVIGGLNGGVPVALAVDSYGDVNATGGQFGAICAPGDITTVCMKDEFVSGQGSLANVGVGDLRWLNSTIGSASTFAAATGVFPNLGLLQWTTASGQGDGSSIQLNTCCGQNTGPFFGALGSNANWDSEYILKMSASTATRMRVGWMNALTTCYTTNVTSVSATCDGFWLRYDTNAPAAVNVGNNGIARASGVVTVTVATHGMSLVGQSVTIAGATGCTTSPNGTFVVASIPSTTTYTFAQAGVDETCGGNAPATSTPVASTDYFFETKSGAGTPVATAVDTTVAGVTTFIRVRIQSTVAGTIVFSLYGPTGALLAGPTSIGTTVATTNMAPDIHFVSDTSGAKIVQVDYWSFAATGLAR